MEFYSQAFEDAYGVELNPEDWCIELAVVDVLWNVWHRAVNVFYFQLYLKNPNKELSDSDVKKMIIKFFWNDIHSHLLGDAYLGDSKKETFFIDALSNNENTQETLDFCLMYLMNIACAYACDAYLAYCENPTDYKFMYYLGQAHHFKGLLVATHAEKLSDEEELKNKMTELANIRHEKNKIKERKIKEEIRGIWVSNNWSSYTECANHIHQKNLIEESNFRKIYTLISKVAKEKT